MKVGSRFNLARYLALRYRQSTIGLRITVERD